MTYYEDEDKTKPLGEPLVQRLARDIVDTVYDIRNGVVKDLRFAMEDRIDDLPTEIEIMFWDLAPMKSDLFKDGVNGYFEDKERDYGSRHELDFDVPYPRKVAKILHGVKQLCRSGWEEAYVDDWNCRLHNALIPGKVNAEEIQKVRESLDRHLRELNHLWDSCLKPCVDEHDNVQLPLDKEVYEPYYSDLYNIVDAAVKYYIPLWGLYDLMYTACQLIQNKL